MARKPSPQAIAALLALLISPAFAQESDDAASDAAGKSAEAEAAEAPGAERTNDASAEEEPDDALGDGADAAPAKRETPAASSDDGLDAARRGTPADSESTPAVLDLGNETPIEDDDSWLKWPFRKADVESDEEAPHRWMSVGGFAGWVSRPSHSSAIKYKPGYTWGGYLRPELTSWLGLRLHYREERIPAEVEVGAFDFEGDTYDDKFSQGDLEILNLGGRLEPTYVVHPRFRVRGAVGWSWVWFQAPFPYTEDFRLKRAFRSAVQMDVTLGAGLSFDIVKNWIDFSLDGSYGISASRTGSAYDSAQIVKDGKIGYIGPLPRPAGVLDFLLSLGVIL